jgi:hypothetical protein
VVGAGQAARGEQHDEEQRGHGEADDDCGEYQCLWQRVGVVQQVLGDAVLDYRFLADEQTAHAENEQIDAIRQQAQAHDHLERPWPQDQPDAGRGEHADGDCDDFFHQTAPLVATDLGSDAVL